MKQNSTLLRWFIYAALTLWLVIASLPIVWTAIISFRQYVDAFSSPVKWVAPFTLENYTALWIDRKSVV